MKSKKIPCFDCKHLHLNPDNRSWYCDVDDIGTADVKFSRSNIDERFRLWPMYFHPRIIAECARYVRKDT